MSRSIRYSALVAAAAAGAGMTAAPAQSAISAQCHSKTATYLFWPQGHGKRPIGGLPAFPFPHLELYRGKRSTTYPDAAADAYIDSMGNAAADKKCDRSKGPFGGGSIARAKTLTAEGRVVCGFGADVVHRLGKVSGGARIRTLRKGKPVVDATIKASGSTISFDTRYCKAGAAPG